MEAPSSGLSNPIKLIRIKATLRLIARFADEIPDTENSMSLLLRVFILMLAAIAMASRLAPKKMNSEA